MNFATRIQSYAWHFSTSAPQSQRPRTDVLERWVGAKLFCSSAFVSDAVGKVKMIDSRGFLSLASRAFALSVVCGMGCMTVVANPVNISYLEGQIPVAPDAVAAYGPDLFGDKVNLFNGSLVFEHTDLNLPGNNALPVALVRKHMPGRDWIVRGHCCCRELNPQTVELSPLRTLTAGQSPRRTGRGPSATPTTRRATCLQ